MGELVRNFPAEGTGIVPPPGPRSTDLGEQSQSISQSQGAQAQGAGGQEGVSGLAEQAKEMVSQQVFEKAGRSADDLREVARVLRQTKDQLGGNMAAPYVDQAARQLERLSGFLRTADAHQVIRSVEGFARREPLLFLGGAFTLGILAARFLKSSARSQGEWADFEGRGRERRAYMGREHEGYSASGRDPRSIAHQQYPQAETEPRSDISHSAEGPEADYARGPGGGL